jgi:hypothetical protein
VPEDERKEVWIIKMVYGLIQRFGVWWDTEDGNYEERW